MILPCMSWQPDAVPVSRATKAASSCQDASALPDKWRLWTVALTIKQPWAWLIVAGHKDIENRNWPTKFRGRFIIHASRHWSPSGARFARKLGIELPDDLPRGGIIGSAELVDCVTEHESPWFEGRYGFVLAKPQALPFKKRLGATFFWKLARR